MKLIQEIKDKKRQLIRFLFGSFSVTALMFTFQACYGMPNNQVPPNEDVIIMATITDMETGQPVEGLAVNFPDLELKTTTDSAGVFCVSVNRAEHPYQVQLLVNDTDNTENGHYETLDTFFTYDDLLTPFDLQVRPHRGK
ncbi:MAG: hypothetical protein K5882_04780 [Bacteroidales bacterium]|nr:hypothetical protein [Bacteroidales bacterium]